MSPTKKSQFDDGAELEVIIPAYFCPVVSRVVVLSITVKIVHRLYGLFGNGFVAFFILTKINMSGWVLPACAITSCYWKLEGQNHGTRYVLEMIELMLSCSGACPQKTPPAGTQRFLENAT